MMQEYDDDFFFEEDKMYVLFYLLYSCFVVRKLGSELLFN